MAFEEYFRKFYETTARLETETQNDPQIAQIYHIIDILENKPTQEQTTQALQALQRTNDKLYQKYGDKTSILDLQVLINKLRNHSDVPDPKELIQRPDGKFVQ
jgi:RecG-like helicase